MTGEELDAIEARANAAPPGHQAEHPDDLPGRSLVVCGRERGPVIDRTVVGVEGPERVAVAELYGHAQEDILALVAEMRRLRAELASVTEDRDSIRTVAVEAEAEIHGLRSDRLALRREVGLLRAEVDRLSR